MGYAVNTNYLLWFFVIVLNRGVRIQCESVDSACGAIVEGFVERANETNPNGTDISLDGRENVEYWLYTRERPKGQRFDRNCQYMVEATTFNAQNPTKILVHGWLGRSVPKTTLCKYTKEDYLHVGDYNVICVYWTSFPPDDIYEKAVLGVKSIGYGLAGFIGKLTNDTQNGFENVHLIGHSLGAHIVGFAGKKLNGRVPRITGLDPAKPLYETKSSDERIADGDAKFVDIIHTNSDILGLHEPLGHIDFYPNGGKSQPRCVLDTNGTCSHLKAFKYFAYSILEADEFEAFKCSSWDNFENDQCEGFGETTNMGEYVDQEQSGKYYLKITESYD